MKYTSEANIQNAALIDLAESGHLVWRQNTGAYKDKTGRVIRYGLCVGSSDIIGLTRDGRFLAVEMKTEKGSVRSEQRNFIEAVRAKGGFAGIARSPEDAVRIANGDILD